jgi:hypothetical protein
LANYTERHKSLRIHTQRSACLTLCGSFKINDSNGEYAIYYDAVYSYHFIETGAILDRLGRFGETFPSKAFRLGLKFGLQIDHSVVPPIPNIEPQAALEAYNSDIASGQIVWAH